VQQQLNDFVPISRFSVLELQIAKLNIKITQCEEQVNQSIHQLTSQGQHYVPKEEHEALKNKFENFQGHMDQKITELCKNLHQSQDQVQTLKETMDKIQLHSSYVEQKLNSHLDAHTYDVLNHSPTPIPSVVPPIGGGVTNPVPNGTNTLNPDLFVSKAHFDKVITFVKGLVPKISSVHYLLKSLNNKQEILEAKTTKLDKSNMDPSKILTLESQVKEIWETLEYMDRSESFGTLEKRVRVLEKHPRIYPGVSSAPEQEINTNPNPIPETSLRGDISHPTQVIHTHGRGKQLNAMSLQNTQYVPGALGEWIDPFPHASRKVTRENTHVANGRYLQDGKQTMHCTNGQNTQSYGVKGNSSSHPQSNVQGEHDYEDPDSHWYPKGSKGELPSQVGLKSARTHTHMFLTCQEWILLQCTDNYLWEEMTNLMILKKKNMRLPIHWQE
jgi:hypothetical protein